MPIAARKDAKQTQATKILAGVIGGTGLAIGIGSLANDGSQYAVQNRLLGQGNAYQASTARSEAQQAYLGTVDAVRNGTVDAGRGPQGGAYRNATLGENAERYRLSPDGSKDNSTAGRVFGALNVTRDVGLNV